MAKTRTTPLEPELEEVRRRFVETFGHLAQSLGGGRAIGLIFAHVYFSPTPQTLNDVTAALGISKGSASMGMRQLEQWGAFRRVWMKGDRKVYYQASNEFGNIVRRIAADAMSRVAESSERALTDAEAILQAAGPERYAQSENWRFVRHRVKMMREFKTRASRIWNHSIVRLLLKK